MLLLLAIACKPPPVEAPTDMSDLSRFVFREWENAETLPAGVLNLETLLEGEDLTAADTNERSWVVDPLTEADVATVARDTEREVDNCQTMSIAYESPWPIDEHPAYMVLADLTVISTSAVIYDRTFPDLADDPSCFVDGSCDELKTENWIDRETALFKMEYEAHKDYRWVDLGDGRRAIASRATIPVAAHGDNDRNHLWQNYESDVWIERDDGTTWRFYAVYTEAEYAGVGEDMARNLSRGQAQTALETLDAFIEENQ